MWQELALTVANAVLMLPLIPSVINSEAKVPRLTSGPTSLCLFVIGTTYVSLGFTIAATTAYAQFVLWGFIFIFRPVSSGYKLFIRHPE